MTPTTIPVPRDLLERLIEGARRANFHVCVAEAKALLQSDPSPAPSSHTETPCEICGRPVIDYDPMYCCNGVDCACYGLPTNPCVCSKECADALYQGIGKSMEQRRIDAGIERFTPSPVQRITADAKDTQHEIKRAINDRLFDLVAGSPTPPEERPNL